MSELHKLGTEESVGEVTPTEDGLEVVVVLRLPNARALRGPFGVLRPETTVLIKHLDPEVGHLLRGTAGVEGWVSECEASQPSGRR